MSLRENAFFLHDQKFAFKVKRRLRKHLNMFFHGGDKEIKERGGNRKRRLKTQWHWHWHVHLGLIICFKVIETSELSCQRLCAQALHLEDFCFPFLSPKTRHFDASLQQNLTIYNAATFTLKIKMEMILLLCMHGNVSLYDKTLLAFKSECESYTAIIILENLRAF